MAGRCGCASAPSTGAAAAGSGCLAVTGAGTPASPFVIGTASGCVIPKVCTSTTRPTSPATGQLIYETDTAMVKKWTGAQWRPSSWGDGGAFTLFDTGHLPVAPAATAAGVVTLVDYTQADPGYPYTLLVGGACQASGGALESLWDLRLSVDGILKGQSRFFVSPDGGGGSVGSGYIVPIAQAKASGSATVLLQLAPQIPAGGVTVVASAGTYLSGQVLPS